MVGALVLNVVALAWHPSVPPDAEAGTVVYGGPGGGFFFLFMVVLPWLSMQAINLPLAWAGSVTVRH